MKLICGNHACQRDIRDHPDFYQEIMVGDPDSVRLVVICFQCYSAMRESGLLQRVSVQDYIDSGCGNPDCKNCGEDG